ncbi:AAA family ATPase [Halalkalibacter oceani]|uniref:AAA family ATPase n=1 Tax=Halalkalibacter oceani TaxID=1653776 RepID=UPI00339723AB
MQITFKELTLKNHKSHRDLTVNFGEVTKISGDNAKGKSSIIESITWLLYGNDTTGSKLDPTPTNYEADATMVSLLLSIDDKDVLLGRELKDGKTKYYVNEVPSKATDFNAIVDSFGDKPFFLSLFNPKHFYTMHWEKQRAMLLQYVSAPTSKQVFNEMSRVSKDQKVKDIELNPQAAKLSELVKKQSLDDLQKIHRESKTKLEKAHIAAESRAKTLKEQLDSQEVQGTAEAEEKLEELKQQLSQVDDESYALAEKNKAHENKKNEINNLLNEKQRLHDRYMKLYEERIQEDCPTCRRPLDEVSVATVKENRNKELAEMRVEYEELKANIAQLQEELLTLPYVDREAHHEKARQLSNQISELNAQIRQSQQRNKLQEQLEQAQQQEQATLKSLNESIFILDAIKAYKAKEAELQGEKVQKLFTTLSVRLFEEQKNGEIKPTFVIQMDGKDYSMLSLSESIKAGLELREVLSQQSGVIAPCFVDNSESITNFKGPSGQLIIAQVVAGQELKIGGDSE